MSLDELYRRTITFPDPGLRIAGLELALTTIEAQLAYLRDQAAVQLKAKLKREAPPMHPDDIEDEQYRVTHTVDALYPKIFRAGFVISLWSVFEACLKDLAEYTRRERQMPFGLQDLRAGDFLKQTEKFFVGALDLDPFPDRTIRKKLDQIRGIRNALAHHDGNIDEFPSDRPGQTAEERKTLGFEIHSDLHHTYAVPTDDFARRSLSTISLYLAELAARLYGRIHPTPLP